MSVLQYDRSSRIVRIAQTWDNIKKYIECTAFFDIVRIAKGEKNTDGTQWVYFFGGIGEILRGSHSDIMEVKEK